MVMVSTHCGNVSTHRGNAMRVVMYYVPPLPSFSASPSGFYGRKRNYISNREM